MNSHRGPHKRPKFDRGPELHGDLDQAISDWEQEAFTPVESADDRLERLSQEWLGCSAAEAYNRLDAGELGDSAIATTLKHYRHLRSLEPAPQLVYQHTPASQPFLMPCRLLAHEVWLKYPSPEEIDRAIEEGGLLAARMTLPVPRCEPSHFCEAYDVPDGWQPR